MKKKFKRNQIIITALALLIALAGYINYMGNIKGKNDKKVSTGQEEVVEPGDAILTNSAAIESKVSELKLNREQVRSKNLEALYEIINNEALDAKSKADAVASVEKIAKNSELELAVEISLEAKGYNNVIANMSDDGIDVMLNVGQIDDITRAQIEDTIVRKSGVSVEHIVITPIVDKITEEDNIVKDTVKEQTSASNQSVTQNNEKESTSNSCKDTVKQSAK